MTLLTPWPKDVAQRLDQLIDRCGKHPYGGWQLGANASFVLHRALDQLRELGLDAEAAAAALAAVDYLVDEDVDEYWREVWRKLGIERPTDFALFELHKEGHVERLLRVNAVPGRSDPTTWNQVRSPEELWRLVERAREGLISDTDAAVLNDLNKRPTWVLLWDQNFSGTHMCDWTKRLSVLQGTMPGLGPHRLLQASAIATEAALDRLRRSCPNVGLIVGRTLIADFSQRNPEFGKRLHKLCQQFHRKLFQPAERGHPRRHRDVDEFGYKSGGLLLVQQKNCPNNSLPFLWYSDSDRYDPPFPRISPYGDKHPSPTPPKLRDLTTSSRDLVVDYQAANALALAMPPHGCVNTARNGRPYDTWERVLSDMIRDLGGETGDDVHLARRAEALAAWLPPEEDKRTQRLRHGALVAIGLTALRTGQLAKTHSTLRELDGSSYKPSARDDDVFDAAMVQFERKFKDAALTKFQTGGGRPTMNERKVRIRPDRSPGVKVPSHLLRWSKLWPGLANARIESPGKPVPIDLIASWARWTTKSIDQQRSQVSAQIGLICRDLGLERIAIPNHPGNGYLLSLDYFELDEALAEAAVRRKLQNHPHRKLARMVVELARGGGNNHRCVPATSGLLLERVWADVRETLAQEKGHLIEILTTHLSTCELLLDEISRELWHARILPEPPAPPVTATRIRNALGTRLNGAVLVVQEIDCALHAQPNRDGRVHCVRELCRLGIPVIFTSLRPIRYWTVVEDAGSVPELHDLDPGDLADDWATFSGSYGLDRAVCADYFKMCGNSPALFDALARGQPVEPLRANFAREIWTRLPTLQSGLVDAARGKLTEFDKASKFTFLWNGILRERTGVLYPTDPALVALWAAEHTGKAGSSVA